MSDNPSTLSAEGAASARDILFGMETPVCAALDLTRGLLCIAEKGALHHGLDPEECEAAARIAGHLLVHVHEAKESWRSAFAVVIGRPE